MNAEIISLLEMALWEADHDRMQNGLEPLREMTDADREFLTLTRERNKRFEAMKENPPPQIADIDLPFFDDGPTQREIYDKLFARLDRIEKKLDDKG